MKRTSDKILLAMTWFGGLLTFFILISIINYILIKGIPYIKPSMFAVKYTSENLSLFPSLITTLIITLLSLTVAVPLGVSTGIYLVEYSKKGSKVVEIIRLTIETLSGIPSIVYGLFGMLFFVTYMKLGYSVLAGGLTLSIMILPLIIRTTEEALKSVPDNLREGSFGLGAGKLRTIMKIVLPAAAPGIGGGVILAIGRIVGETAALIYTAGTVAKIPLSLMDSGRTLSVHMYALSGEGLNMGEAYGTAVVLLLLVILINGFSSYVIKKFKTQI